MLLVNQIRDNYAGILAGLQKRNFHNAPAILDQVIALDDLRKSTQSERDQIQAEANTISKEIGLLMKAGRAEEAVVIRERTAQIKEQIKDLEAH
jgi:seryl-tRNA synthetase